MHFSEQSHEQRCFARASLSNNEVDTATLEEHFIIDAKREVSFMASGRGCAVTVRGPSKVCSADADRAFFHFRLWKNFDFNVRLRRVLVQKFSLQYI